MKCNFILDLDQTLISAEATEEYDFNKHTAKAKKFDFEDMDGYYIIFSRPYLQTFLDFIFKHFNVSVWTAASKDYALFIIDKIIIGNRPNRKIDWVFFSYHCNVSNKKKGGSKNLSMLWDIYKCRGYHPYNTIILDDYDEVYDTQPDNCIIAKPFEFLDKASYNDTFLKDLMPHLLKMKQNMENKKGSPASIVNINMKLKKNN
jgi:TFIIF-interacting CTD phosphatase-like protein